MNGIRTEIIYAIQVFANILVNCVYGLYGDLSYDDEFIKIRMDGHKIKNITFMRDKLKPVMRCGGSHVLSLSDNMKMVPHRITCMGYTFVIKRRHDEFVLIVKVPKIRDAHYFRCKFPGIISFDAEDGIQFTNGSERALQSHICM